jgi:GH15 family glucan-1,4-alpha-glucosidase
MTLNQAVIGNGNMIGLVAPDSGVDWLCMPRFDSPSVFARLLDQEKGGTWRFLPSGKVQQGQMRYVRNTNVLVTRFEDETGAWDLFDFMPRIPDGLRHKTPYRFVRLLRPVRGRPRVKMEFDPRPDYGREQPKLMQAENGLRFQGCGQPHMLTSNLPTDYILNGNEFAVDLPRFFVLDYGIHSESQHIDEVNRDLDLTIAGWRMWVQNSNLAGFADDQVIRSSLCLKLHAYNNTGAIIAATTTSIPESIGEPRTWDYRYCWLRDSVFTVEALRRLAHFQEGRNFLRFVLDVAENGPLQPLYGIGGERSLEEFELPHLAGYQNTQPVRIGNAAAEQLQTDLMGEVVLCLRSMMLDPRVDFREPRVWLPLLKRMVQESIDAFLVPDLGIWEYRGEPLLHTFSRAMCWAAVHHGAEVAEGLEEPELAAQWRVTAAEMHQEILKRGYNKDLGMFTQTFDGDEADAANLLLPSIGLIAPTDELFINTLDSYRELLVRERGVMRYVHDDDFGAPTSTFTICSFWWIEALALAGRLEESIEMFQRVTSHANPLGLFSEDVDAKTGELLGNFPQAYTHVGLINAAMTIGTLLRAEEGNFHAWA